MHLLRGVNRLLLRVPVAAQGLESLLSIAVGPGGQGIRCLIVARILHQEEAAHTQNHGCRSSGKADPHRLSGGGRLGSGCKLLAERLHGGGSLLLVGLHGCLQNCLCLLVHRELLPLDGGLAGKGVDQGGRQHVNIAGFRQGAGLVKGLRRAVALPADAGAHRAGASCGDDVLHVRTENQSGIGEDQIPGVDIAVEDSCLMQPLERSGSPGKQRRCGLPLHGLAGGNLLFQGFARHRVQHAAAGAVLQEQIPDVDDPGHVRQGGIPVGIGAEALDTGLEIPGDAAVAAHLNRAVFPACDPVSGQIFHHLNGSFQTQVEGCVAHGEGLCLCRAQKIPGVHNGAQGQGIGRRRVGRRVKAAVGTPVRGDVRHAAHTFVDPHVLPLLLYPWGIL